MRETRNPTRLETILKTLRARFRPAREIAVQMLLPLPDPARRARRPSGLRGGLRGHP